MTELETMLDEDIEQLITDLQQKVGLERQVAIRTAFVVCAYQAGYPKATIARWMGVVRERVEQLLQKAERYLIPELQDRLADRRQRAPQEWLPRIGYDREAWNDEAFALGMLQRVANETKP